MSEQAIASLALISAEWEQGGSYVGCFVPLRTAPQAEVSLPQLRQAVADTFGFSLPLGTLKSIVKRTVKEGYARVEYGIYRRDDDALDALGFTQRRAKALRECEALVDKLVGFCEEKHEVIWTNEEAEAYLFAHIRTHHIPLLTSIVRGTPVPGSLQTERQTEFLVDAFINYLCERDPDGFKYLETVVKGSMLANALFFPDLGRVQQRFGRARIYFDTQFLLRALGEAGADLQAPCKELLDLLYALNAEIRCFQQTSDEMGGILEFVANALRQSTSLRRAYGEVLEHYLRTGLRASDAELALVRLKNSLLRLRVQVERMPTIKTEFSIDEGRFTEILREEVKYSREAALLHDLAALRSIHHLRRGSFPRRFEQCDAVFVTTNASLARASRVFFEEQYGRDAIAIPHCITDHVLTTLAWLKKPHKAPELPRKVLIANCYAALQPSDRLWRSYVDKATELQAQGDISEDEFYLLRFSVEAREILMGMTLGDPDAFVEGTIQEVLRRAMERLRAADRAELAAEIKRRKEAEQRAEATIVLSQRQTQAQRNRLRSVAVTIGMWGGRISLTSFIALQIVGFCLVVWPGLLKGGLRWLFLGCLVLLAVLQAIDLTWGRTLKSVVRQIEVIIADGVEEFLIRIAVPGEDNQSEDNGNCA
jgi:hypothetical protein